MNFVLINHKFQYECEKLIRIFFPNTKITAAESRNDDENYIVTSVERFDGSAQIFVKAVIDQKENEEKKEFLYADKFFDEDNESYIERKLAIMLYKMLVDLTGYVPPWGILTGVRPAKLMTTMCGKYGEEITERYFLNELYVSKEKVKLAKAVAEKENPIIASSKPDSFSLYISIPFCPSRCSYCSFVSHSNEAAKKLIPDYVRLLCREIEETAKIASKLHLKLESIYMGGGTPTALDAERLKEITDAVSKNFSIGPQTEYTIEAGRPDSVTDEKFEVIQNAGATRISINPQTFNDSVLEVIGRKHTSQMTIDALKKARNFGFKNLNMDLIAGLPTDTPESFENTLNQSLSFSPENITIHTLALKRASALVTENMQKGDVNQVGKMLDHAFEVLTNSGYSPYYMYRQSNCLGNLENVGWSKGRFECRYNVYMMEECHTVLAVGAGAVTKLRSPYGPQIERIFNYKYPYEYMNDFDEILRRKERIAAFYNEQSKS